MMMTLSMSVGVIIIQNFVDFRLNFASEGMAFFFGRSFVTLEKNFTMGEG